ncbi:hypothetical protein [Streptomyces mirabilis]|uniref:hypothetical protein n=1 Tax=Streptomyces mirabilis TaxID=68239 RepID=UPI00369CECE1
MSEAGLWARSLPTFAAGTLLAGTGIGLAFRRGVGGAQRLADPRRRADLISTYFLFAYTGTIVPTLAPGLLYQTISQDVATLILAVAVVATTLASTQPPHHRHCLSDRRAEWLRPSPACSMKPRQVSRQRTGVLKPPRTCDL